MPGALARSSTAPNVLAALPGVRVALASSSGASLDEQLHSPVSSISPARTLSTAPVAAAKAAAAKAAAIPPSRTLRMRIDTSIHSHGLYAAAEPAVAATQRRARQQRSPRKGVPMQSAGAAPRSVLGTRARNRSRRQASRNVARERLWDGSQSPLPQLTSTQRRALQQVAHGSADSHGSRRARPSISSSMLTNDDLARIDVHTLMFRQNARAVDVAERRAATHSRRSARLHTTSPLGMQRPQSSSAASTGARGKGRVQRHSDAASLALRPEAPLSAQQLPEAPSGGRMPAPGPSGRASVPKRQGVRPYGGLSQATQQQLRPHTTAVTTPTTAARSGGGGRGRGGGAGGGNVTRSSADAPRGHGSAQSTTAGIKSGNQGGRSRRSGSKRRTSEASNSSHGGGQGGGAEVDASSRALQLQSPHARHWSQPVVLPGMRTRTWSGTAPA